ncbi:hypothetical protein [Kribbella sp. NPDC023855]|uniref:hypothetical protein n=1 Tax=Kribbella sp. NPDC023855 TaxID=3154698 RepID=UPI0033ED0599
MSTEVKLAGRLPASPESNGMHSVLADLLQTPKTQRLYVVWGDVLEIKRNLDTGDEIPTLRVLKIEPLGEVDEVSQAIREEVMRKAEERLGHTPLPFDEHDPDGVTVLPTGDPEDDDDAEGPQ